MTELRHKNVVSGAITEAEFKATNQHIADGGLPDELLVVKADETLDSEPVNTAIASHISTLDAHTFNSLELIRTGTYFGSPAGEVSTNTLTASRMYATPIIVARAITVEEIAIEVTTGDAGKVARVGIYNNGTNLYPGTLVIDGGEVSVAGVALVTAAIADTVLTKGIYWLAVVGDGTPTLRGWASDDWWFPILGRDPAMLTRWHNHWYVALAYTAGVTTLPDPFTAGATLTWGTALCAYVKVKSLD